MNKIINKFLLTADKFTLELHLKHPGVTYSTCGLFSKHRERIQKFKETGNLKHLHSYELACFAHNGAYSNSKDLAKRTVSDNIMKDTAYGIGRNPKFDGYQRTLAGMIYKFFYKKTGSGAIATSKAGVSVNEELAEELHKPVIEKFKRTKVYARFKDNIWAAYLA